MDPTDEQLVTLLNAPSPAVLTTYRQDGTAVGSPVWFRRDGNALEVVIADGDVKLRHLERRPLCSLLVFEATSPFRAVRVEASPTLDRQSVDETRRAIARLYLGTADGDRFSAGRGPGAVLRLPLHGARAWDLRSILPS